MRYLISQMQTTHALFLIQMLWYGVPCVLEEFILKAFAQGILQKAAKMKSVKPSSNVRFDGKTVIITGAGAGLGRVYALMYAKLGANVVVNDVSAPGAEAVVEEIKKGRNLLQLGVLCHILSQITFSVAGGKAIAAVASAEDGEAIVKTALDAFGAVHILVANAGILRDKSFSSMTAAEWDAVFAVHFK